MISCFISYSWDSPANKEWVFRLAKTIEQFKIRVVFDQSREQNPDGGNIPLFIQKGIMESNFILIVVTSQYVQKADDIQGYIGQETTLIQQRFSDSDARPVLPLLREGTTLPAYLYGTKYIDMRHNGEYARQLTEVLRHMNALKKGIALRDAVFKEDDPLPDKVFAIELLRQPLWISRLKGRTTVSISRKGVELGVYTVAGKNNVLEDTFPGEVGIRQAIDLDKDIHRLFRSEEDLLHKYSLDKLNLRWASGGVLSRVQYQGRHWFAFFFRDIEPFGWNISLGASEHESELTDPWKFLMREFLEETLICTPTGGPQTARRPLDFDRYDVTDVNEQAETLSAEHRELRRTRDGVDFRKALGERVHCDFLQTRTQLIIDGSEPIRNILICINFTELGIEILKVLSYDLSENDFILDGEIYKPEGKNQVELVRMPVALISEEYLRRAFATENLNYVSPFEARHPSIEGPPIPSTEIIIFPQDVERRSQLVCNCSLEATEWEKKQYSLWLERFGYNFFDNEGKPTNVKASALFTPTSAKAMAYYFANQDSHR